MTHPADVIDIARQAAILVGKAEALGVTLRITGEPLKPLAMGNQRHVIDAWASRHSPNPKADPLEPGVVKEWKATPLMPRTHSG